MEPEILDKIIFGNLFKYWLYYWEREEGSCLLDSKKVQSRDLSLCGAGICHGKKRQKREAWKS